MNLVSDKQRNICRSLDLVQCNCIKNKHHKNLMSITPSFAKLQCDSYLNSIMILLMFSQKYNFMQETLGNLLTKHKDKKTEIQINPWEAIPIKNSKKAKETTQLHLGGKSGTKLTNFTSFPNLQILWLNNNSLTNISGLQCSFRIKHLFLQHNKLTTIEGIFQKLKHIETLILYDNELRDLDKIIKNLKSLTNLQQLDTFDNPAAHQPNYKFRVLFAIPSLGIIDRHKITYAEKVEAETFMNQNKGKKRKGKPFA